MTTQHKELEVQGLEILFRYKIHNLIIQIHQICLKEELSTFKQKAEDLENKLIEFQKQSDELSQETQEQASKVIQLQELVER